MCNQQSKTQRYKEQWKWNREKQQTVKLEKLKQENAILCLKNDVTKQLDIQIIAGPFSVDLSFQLEFNYIIILGLCINSDTFRKNDFY